MAVAFRCGSSPSGSACACQAENATSGIVFDQLPLGTEIRIYTMTGRLVAELRSDAGGALQWDARNSDGREAASGPYVAVMKAQGEKTVVKKLVIIR